MQHILFDSYHRGAFLCFHIFTTINDASETSIHIPACITDTTTLLIITNTGFSWLRSSRYHHPSPVWRQFPQFNVTSISHTMPVVTALSHTFTPSHFDSDGSETQKFWNAGLNHYFFHQPLFRHCDFPRRGRMMSFSQSCFTAVYFSHRASCVIWVKRHNMASIVYDSP